MVKGEFICHFSNGRELIVNNLQRGIDHMINKARYMFTDCINVVIAGQ